MKCIFYTVGFFLNLAKDGSTHDDNQYYKKDD